MYDHSTTKKRKGGVHHFIYDVVHCFQHLQRNILQEIMYNVCTHRKAFN